MNLETLIGEINNLKTIFEGGDESAAIEIIRTMDPDLLNGVKLDNLQKNAEFVKALDGLSEFKDKIKAEIPSFVTRIYNLGEKARNTLNG